MDTEYLITVDNSANVRLFLVEDFIKDPIKYKYFCKT